MYTSPYFNSFKISPRSIRDLGDNLNQTCPSIQSGESSQSTQILNANKWYVNRLIYKDNARVPLGSKTCQEYVFSANRHH